MNAPSADFAEIILRTDTEEPVRLGDAWAEGPAVLVWLRHFG
jgi:hypothetical protein